MAMNRIAKARLAVVPPAVGRRYIKDDAVLFFRVAIPLERSSANWSLAPPFYSVDQPYTWFRPFALALGIIKLGMHHSVRVRMVSSRGRKVLGCLEEEDQCMGVYLVDPSRNHHAATASLAPAWPRHGSEDVLLTGARTARLTCPSSS
jgi:hypothetical protein